MAARAGANLLSIPETILKGIIPADDSVHFANYEKQHTMTGGELYVDWEGLEARFRDRRQSSRAKTQKEAVA
jgi:hypothetical protein